MRHQRLRQAWWLLASLSGTYAATHDVRVGRGGAVFDPETLTADKGDVITYSFHSGSHSVMQTSLKSPCQPLEGGFSSGAVSAEGGVSPVTWRIVVNETTPVFVYSGEGDDCRQGKIQVINPSPTGNATLASFRKAASNSTVGRSTGNEPFGGQRILKIGVGANEKLAFEPSDARGQIPGTVVQFHFHPKNNSVVQASYDDPCHPKEGGFTSGFIPIESSSAGVDFSVMLNDTDAVYFYDAQTDGSHCQRGMVGSINAPTKGKTQESFASKAADASSSTHPTYAPSGGTLTVNNSIIPSLHGAVLHLDMLNSSLLSAVPRPDEIDQSIILQAGGGPMALDLEGKKLSDATAEHLQLLMYTDNILLETLLDGNTRLATGEWQGVFPETIMGVLQATAAQSYVHRSMSSYPLRHFKRGVPLPCAYTLPLGTVDGFVSTVLTLLLLEIGLYGDFVASMGADDGWFVPALAGALGAKARAAGLLNMMQNHTVAPASGEVQLPPGLVYSYLARYVGFCPEGDDASAKLLRKFRTLPRLGVSASGMTPNGGRVTTVGLEYEGDGNGDGKHVAWVGAYGQVRFSEVKEGVAEVPGDLFGHVWAVVTKKKGIGLDELTGAAVAGPEMVWVAEP